MLFIEPTSALDQDVGKCGQMMEFLDKMTMMVSDWARKVRIESDAGQLKLFETRRTLQ